MSTAPAPTNELTRLQLLRSYKERLVRHGDVNLSPFSLARVVRYDSDVRRYDVPDIHRDARERIAKIIKAIHQGHDSQVVILAGNPGMGKSHLINHFRSPEVSEDMGYVLVCNSNHWKADEFEACLLNWVLEALVHPSPDKAHLLLAKVQDVAFEALGQVLAQPGRLRRFERPRRLTGRLWRVLLPGHDRLRQLVEARNPRAFAELDFARFSREVCDRFLHNSGNPFHRHVLSVLLRYLFEDERERVLHWLRGRDVSFQKATGVDERIDAHYKVMDAIKILVSLFTAEVSRSLRPVERAGARGRVFFFAFDQMEGRQELFESEADWMKFFGQLSELYNTLPNVFVLFTMTLALRNRLYPQMEGQFQDRITRDERFQLHRIPDPEFLALYRKRVDCWLGDAAGGVDEQLALINQPYLPFTQDEVLALSAGKTLRESLAALDEEFCRYFERLITGPRVDYLGFLNHFRAREQELTPNEYTANHLDRVKHLFDRHGAALAGAHGLGFTSAEWRETEQRLPAVCMRFHDPKDEARWVRVFLARLPWNYNQYKQGCFDLLHSKWTGHNFLWLVRSPKIDADLEASRPGQVFARPLPATVHTSVQALVELLGNRASYAPEEQAVADEVVREEIKPTYLGSMLRQLRDALTAQEGAAADGKDVGEAAGDDG
jgi:hypothetical protein